MTAIIGHNLSIPTTSPTAGLGDIQTAPGGKVYQYVRANGAVIASAVVSIDENFDATEATQALILTGMPLGVAPAVAMADNEYFWVQLEGPTTVAVQGNPSVDAQLLNHVSVDGVLDDTASSAATAVNGIMLTTAAGTTALSTAAALIVRRMEASATSDY